MALRTVPEDDDLDQAAVRPKKRRPARLLHTAKPEEGDDRGELLHFLRALPLLVVATAAFGWLVS